MKSGSFSSVLNGEQQRQGKTVAKSSQPSSGAEKSPAKDVGATDPAAGSHSHATAGKSLPLQGRLLPLKHVGLTIAGEGKPLVLTPESTCKPVDPSMIPQQSTKPGDTPASGGESLALDLHLSREPVSGHAKTQKKDSSNSDDSNASALLSVPAQGTEPPVHVTKTTGHASPNSLSVTDQGGSGHQSGQPGGQGKAATVNIPQTAVPVVGKAQVKQADGKGGSATATAIKSLASLTHGGTPLPVSAPAAAGRGHAAKTDAGRAITELSNSTTSSAPTSSMSRVDGGQAALPTAQASVPVEVGKPGWSDQVMERVMWMSSQHINKADIALNPPDLGPLQIRIHAQGDQMTVAFSAAHGMVRDALDQGLPRLRDMMAHQGLNLVNVDVSGQNLSSHSQGGGGQPQPESHAGQSVLSDDLLSPVAEREQDVGGRVINTRIPGLVDYYA